MSSSGIITHRDDKKGDNTDDDAEEISEGGTDGQMNGGGTVGKINLGESDGKINEAGNVVKKRCRKSVAYVFEKFIENIDVSETHEEIIKKNENSESRWFRKQTIGTVIGQTMLYECLYKCCPAKLKLIIDSERKTGTILYSDVLHIHTEGFVDKPNGIKQDVKELILKWDKMHLKPRAILRNLRDVENIQIPSITQLNNFLKHTRDKMSTTKGSTMCIQDFDDFYEANKVNNYLLFF